jgi:hypothetical protein
MTTDNEFKELLKAYTLAVEENNDRDWCRSNLPADYEGEWDPLPDMENLANQLLLAFQSRLAVQPR